MENPAFISALVHQLVPLVAILFTFGMPVAIVWTVKHFQFKKRELELEAELHGREMEMRLRTLEARQAAVETALGALGGRPLPAPPPVEQRMSLLEPPATSSETAEANPTDPLRLRSR
jgi:hypothetical protein